MTTDEPHVPDSSRYNITAASQILGVHRNTLLAWAEKRIIRFGVSRVNGRKFFTGHEIKRVWKSVY